MTAAPQGDARVEARAGNDERLGDVRFLTVAEVASLMRVSKMTVYRLVHSNDLTAVRVAGRSRCPSTPCTRICAALSAKRPEDPFSQRAAGGLPWSAQTIRRGRRPEAGEFARVRVKGNIRMGSVVKKRRKRMAKKKHRKLLRKTRVQRRRLGK